VLVGARSFIGYYATKMLRVPTGKTFWWGRWFALDVTNDVTRARLAIGQRRGMNAAANPGRRVRSVVE